MNILYIVPYVPNMIRVRPYNLIQHLSRRGNRVTVATLWSNSQEKEAIEPLMASCERVIGVCLPAWRSALNCLGAIPTRRPLQSAYSWNLELAREIAALVLSQNGRPGFDVVHVEHLRGVGYGLYLKKELSTSDAAVPVVWDSVDSISLLFRQAMVGSKSPLSRGMTRFELGRTERYEGWLLSQFERILVTSPNDRQALLALLPSGPPEPCIEVLRNGVDLTYFTRDESVRREPATLVISGKMSYHANVTMALHLIQDIMPFVWAARPEVRVEIVGKDPPKGIQDLAQDPRIVVTGTVGDLRPYLRKATVAVAPVAYGVGIQNKVLEAMACEAPVVASSQAVSALQVEPGENVIVAQGAVDFAGAILKLLSDPHLREKVGQSGRRYVEEYHDWSVVAARLEQIYQQALN